MVFFCEIVSIVAQASHAVGQSLKPGFLSENIVSWMTVTTWILHGRFMLRPIPNSLYSTIMRGTLRAPNCDGIWK